MVKINPKKYLLIATLVLLPFFFLLRSWQEYMVMISTGLFIYGSQWGFVRLVNKAFAPGQAEKYPKSRLMLLLFVKSILLFGPLSLGVLFMGNRVIIPLLYYVILIFVMYFSLQRERQE